MFNEMTSKFKCRTIISVALYHSSSRSIAVKNILIHQYQYQKISIPIFINLFYLILNSNFCFPLLILTFKFLGHVTRNLGVLLFCNFEGSLIPLYSLYIYKFLFLIKIKNFLDMYEKTREREMPSGKKDSLF